MKEIGVILAYAVARTLLAFVFAAVLAATTVLLWRDVRFVAHTVNVWADHFSR